MSTSISEQKKALRSEIRQRKKAYSLCELSLFSEAICSQIERLPEFSQARTILLYYALPDEVQTQGLIARWSAFKNILLPVVDGDCLRIKAFCGENTLSKNQWDISEPDDSIEDFRDYKNIELAIIPGMAFDQEGHRLGRGKGYYDRLLPLLHCPTIGVCFPFQWIEHVPAESFDVRVQQVIHEGRTL